MSCNIQNALYSNQESKKWSRITRCNQVWEYIKTKAYMSMGLSK